ncbi:MAG: DEAD/DEAH box helicase [Clostridia bacterium]
MNKWLGNTPRKLMLYKRVDGNLILPAGLRGKFNKIPFTESYPQIKRWQPQEPKSYEPYSYQVLAANDMFESKHGGIVLASAGSGKTSIALHAIGSLGVKTLWIADTLDLINQAKNRFIQFYGKQGVGVTTGGKIDIGERITFATLQTLAKIPIENYANEWECVIVDEVQIVSGSPTKITMSQAVLSKLNARLKYGLTATYHRSDGLEKCIWALIGDIIHEVPESATEKTTMIPTVRRIDTSLMPSEEYLDTDGTLMWAKLINYIALDEDRNRQIAYDIEKAGKSILVLSDRKAQLDMLYDFLTDKRFAKIITGSTPRKKREQGIQDMRDGKLRIMLSTFAMSKKGLDIPRLDTLVLASPNKDYALITQAVGRCQRIFKGKTQALVLDYVDSNIRYLDRMYKKRVTSYNKLRARYE